MQRCARFSFIVDGEVAAQLHTAVTGATIEESLAGKYPSAWARWLGPLTAVRPRIIRAGGIDARRYDIVVLKSSNHFRSGFKDIAGTIVSRDQHVTALARR